MHTVQITTRIAASPERCFDLARSVEDHVRSAAASGECVVAGRTAGLLELGEEVTWEGRHFGIRQRLTSRIVSFERPNYFQDRMVRGAFKFFEHDHFFKAIVNGTEMTDFLRFTVPYGPLGLLLERLVLARHLKRFLQLRADHLKAAAERD